MPKYVYRHSGTCVVGAQRVRPGDVVELSGPCPGFEPMLEPVPKVAPEKALAELVSEEIEVPAARPSVAPPTHRPRRTAAESVVE